MSALPLPPAVVCDLDPTVVVTITGPDAAAFLQGQLSNDAVALPEGAAQYTSYNSPKGRMLANFPLWRLHGDCFRPPAGRPGRGGDQAPADVRAAVEGEDRGPGRGHRPLRRRRCRCRRGARRCAGPPRRAAAVHGDRRRGRDGRRAARAALPRGRRRRSARRNRCSAGRARRARPVRRLALARRFAPACRSSPRRRRTCSSRRPRTGTCWAAIELPARGATPGRRSSPGRSTWAGSRSGCSCSTPQRPAVAPGTRLFSRGLRRPALRHRRQRAPTHPAGGADLLAVLQIAAAEPATSRLRGARRAAARTAAAAVRRCRRRRRRADASAPERRGAMAPSGRLGLRLLPDRRRRPARPCRGPRDRRPLQDCVGRVHRRPRPPAGAPRRSVDVDGGLRAR